MCRRKPDRRAGYQAAQEMKQDLGDDHVCPQAIHLYPVRSHHLRYVSGDALAKDRARKAGFHLLGVGARQGTGAGTRLRAIGDGPRVRASSATLVPRASRC